MNKIRKVCKHCGSSDVRKDAWAEWDEDKQEWVLAEFFDNDYCMTCDCETRIVDKEINEEGLQLT